MVSIVEDLMYNYRELVAIQQKQRDIALLERYDDQLDQIRQLEQQKIQYKNAINTIRADSANYEAVIHSHLTELSSCMDELRHLNQQIQVILNTWYSEDSSTMKQVYSHRRTLQTYGGVNYSDVISYFIDDKQ